MSLTRKTVHINEWLQFCITLTKLKAHLTFILVMMVPLFKTCIDLLEQCVIKIWKKNTTCLLIGTEDWNITCVFH